MATRRVGVRDFDEREECDGGPVRAFSSGASLSSILGLGVVTACFAVVAGVGLGWFGLLRSGCWPTVVLLTYPLYLLHQNIGYMVLERLQGGQFASGVLFAGGLFGIRLVAHTVHIYTEIPLARALKRKLAPWAQRIDRRLATHCNVGPA